jgi:ribonucleoside-diphosphate reductase alpha chain
MANQLTLTRTIMTGANQPSSQDMGSLLQAGVDIDAMRTIKRDGTVVAFAAEKIEIAIRKAYLDVMGAEAGNSASTRAKVEVIRNDVVNALWQISSAGGPIAHHIEAIQDTVERALMRAGEHAVARSYVLYRHNRTSARAAVSAHSAKQVITIIDRQGDRVPLPITEISDRVMAACAGLADVTPADVVAAALADLYDGAPIADLDKALIMSARGLLEKEPNYKYVTARLLLDDIRREVLGESVSQASMQARYAPYFTDYIAKGVAAGLISPTLQEFDLDRIGRALDASRDTQFEFLGLQTLYDRYFLHVNDVRIELPQAFYMRVAMGLAINEAEREERAIEFYNLISSFDFMCSTPTLFNSGTPRPQLSSCYLTTVGDDLEAIYDAIKENALLSKFAGGLGNDWTSVRAMGSRIKGTNGKSQGVVPFLKVANDTAVAVNQGGKRKGAVCGYLETWHLDIEEFLDLRKNTGDDRRRTHDMNTANWIPDLFMKRVMQKGAWSLFSPSEVPDLHDKVGRAFEEAYVAYEAKAARGEMAVYKKVEALDLWRKMLSMLFETGHPWITFKDPCNIRSPQQHVGVVHSSNLCTEITLNTNASEIAVCNLGSVNLPAHMKNGKLDHEKLQKTIRTAMRMLDNVIDINYYAVDKARNSNLRHRPVGLGVMGYQDCLYKMRVPFASDAAVTFADNSMEAVCYYAYLASTELAEERGRYESYDGSLWSRGILPQDSIKMLADERGGYLEQDTSETMDWSLIRGRVKQFGMRNSNCVAIAPTATISNIIGVSACIEPTFQNLYVKSNLSGEFTDINAYLVSDLKARGLWDQVMINDLKYFDGALGKIDRVPADLRELYATAFEVEPAWLVEQASRRQKWIDQAQSLNIYMAGASGKKLDETYKLAWLRGLKTTYYLRTIAATHMEKATVRPGALNAVPVTGGIAAEPTPSVDGAACFLRPGDPGFEQCEACQ